MDFKLLAFFLTILFVTSVGFALGFLLKAWINARAKGNLEERLSRMRLEAQDEIREMKDRARQEVDDLRTGLDTRHRAVDEREEKIEERQRRLDRLEERNHQTQLNLEQEQKKLDEQAVASRTLYEERAGLSKEEARARLLHEVADQEQDALSHRRTVLMSEGEEELAREAQNILAVAVQRYGNSIDNDIVSTHVSLADDEIKGKIIVKEGRNIKAFERASGVQLLIDDTP